jgi:4-carboxymuconolactone decarboxylase
MQGSQEPNDLFRKGIEIRRAVLGDAYVQKSLSNPNSFLDPLQTLITEWCWGSVWGRPGIDRKTRSIINIAMLAALNRPNELRLHLRGALNNGVAAEEIQEILLQVAVYCGVPAALDSFKIAAEIVAEQETQRRAESSGSGERRGFDGPGAAEGPSSGDVQA